MGTSAKITSKGQITLPVELRQAMGLKKGDRIVFEHVGQQEYRIRPATSAGVLKGILKPFLKGRKPLSIHQMKEAVTAEVLEKAGKTRPR